MRVFFHHAGPGVAWGSSREKTLHLITVPMCKELEKIKQAVPEGVVSFEFGRPSAQVIYANDLQTHQADDPA